MSNSAVFQRPRQRPLLALFSFTHFSISHHLLNYDNLTNMTEMDAKGTLIRAVTGRTTLLGAFSLAVFDNQQTAKKLGSTVIMKGVLLTETMMYASL